MRLPQRLLRGHIAQSKAAVRYITLDKSCARPSPATARAGAYDSAYEALHEPPTADPHGEWCGGWELDTPGYPIRHRRGLQSGSDLGTMCKPKFKDAHYANQHCD